MFPQLTVHRPRGVLPKVAVQKRTLVDYQPSWWVVAIPAFLVLRAARRRSRSAADQQQAAPTVDAAEPPTSR